MKLESYRCPNCNAIVNPPDNLSDFYCSYCGYKLHISDEVTRSEIVHVYRDEAEIKKLELQEKEQIRAAQKEIELENAKTRNALLPWCIFAALLIASMILTRFINGFVLLGSILCTYFFPPLKNTMSKKRKIILWIITFLAIAGVLDAIRDSQYNYDYYYNYINKFTG